MLHNIVVPKKMLSIILMIEIFSSLGQEILIHQLIRFYGVTEKRFLTSIHFVWYRNMMLQLLLSFYLSI